MTLKHTPKEQLFFSRTYQSQQQNNKNRSMIHFNHNAFLAFSALIIDHFIAPPSRKLHAPAELILKNLDLLKAYPRYPAPETTPQHCLTSEQYMHQLCLVANQPTLLVWLLRSIALVVKRLCIEEIAQHHDYYHYILGHSIEPEKLHQKDDINALNPYVGLALRRVLKFDFVQTETEDRKSLPKNTYSSSIRKTNTALILHRTKNAYLASAIVEHIDLFKPILTPEHTRFLCQEVEQYQVSHFNHHVHHHDAYQKRYLRAQKQIHNDAHSLSELKSLYIESLDKILTDEHTSALALWGKMTGDAKSQIKKIEENATVVLNKRLEEDLKNTLCRFFALGFIRDDALLKRGRLNRLDQDKTFLTEESDNNVMTFS